MDRGDVYNVMLDGQVIETTVEAGDDQSAVANRIAENLNAQAGDKVVASVNDDGTIKIASAAAGVTFEAAVTWYEGRSSETVGRSISRLKMVQMLQKRFYKTRSLK